MAGLNKSKMEESSKKSKLESFQAKFRKGFGGGKDPKRKKGKSEDSGFFKKLFSK